MREQWDEDDFRPAPLPRDTEVTLGPMAVTGLIVALLLLFGLVFILGYSMGSRGSKTAITAAAPASSAPAGAAAKPEAVSPIAPAAPTKAHADASGASQAATTPADSATTQPAGQWMVQIASVSNHDDADVLVSALHKRGYAVSLSQDDATGPFHVRVGPFTSLNDANTMRQKLLNDGYNAVLQP
jgi:cell division septation protein DedD